MYILVFINSDVHPQSCISAHHRADNPYVPNLQPSATQTPSVPLHHHRRLQSRRLSSRARSHSGPVSCALRRGWSWVTAVHAANTVELDKTQLLNHWYYELYFRCHSQSQGHQPQTPAHRTNHGHATEAVNECRTGLGKEYLTSNGSTAV